MFGKLVSVSGCVALCCFFATVCTADYPGGYFSRKMPPPTVNKNAVPQPVPDYPHSTTNATPTWVQPPHGYTQYTMPQPAYTNGYTYYPQPGYATGSPYPGQNRIVHPQIPLRFFPVNRYSTYTQSTPGMYSYTNPGYNAGPSYPAGSHIRQPYYSYRRPWYHPGPATVNRNILW